MDPDSTLEVKLRAIHALTQASTSYIKLIDAGEMVKRLDELESANEKHKTFVN
ncbi:MAG: hypothetical protein ACE5G0_01970 [Rhodothermales bacterium]